MNEAPHHRLHDNGRRVIFPRPPEISLDATQVSEWRNGAVLYYNACVFIRVFFTLSCDGVFLARHWSPGQYFAVLEDGGRVSEYEIHCAVDITFAVELAIRVCVKRVLIRIELATVEH